MNKLLAFTNLHIKDGMIIGQNSVAWFNVDFVQRDGFSDALS